MSRFFAGFATASALWGAAAAATYVVYGAPWDVEPEPAELEAPPDEAPVAEEAPQKNGRRRRRRAQGGRGDRATAGDDRAATADYPRGSATTGDDLGENDARSLDLGGSGGEEQLPGSEIERGFDGAMGRIRRCLVLVPAEAPVTGRLTFGLRIAGSGRVTRVNLQGPAAVTRGESGDCLRDAARAISFRSFDGPEMLVHYPITLE